MRLLLLHLRSHLLFLAVWVLLGLFITGQVGTLYGIRYLLLLPEYHGKVGYAAFVWLGFAFGWLTLTWNLTCYLIHAYRFPFIASLSRPFFRFSQNNSVLPYAFWILLMIESAIVQSEQELLGPIAILINLLSMICGYLLIVGFSVLFFRIVNVDIDYLERKGIKPTALKQPLAPGVDESNIESVKFGDYGTRTDTYLGAWAVPKPVRSVAHYDSSYMLHIFRQNHRNAVVWLSIGLICLFCSGLLLNYPALRAPAGASIFLLSGIIIALSGAVTYWLHRWRYPVFILFILGVNYLTSYDRFELKSKAIGLDYRTPAPYTYEGFENACSPESVSVDSIQALKMLENWKKKTGESKPPLILLNASGGGLRAALWSLRVVGQADSATQGNFMEHVVMMTGASGGMLGLGYAHELAHQKLSNPNICLYDQKYCDHISTDLLNVVGYALVTNDLLVPWLTEESNGNSYMKDRGYYFERQLCDVSRGAFDKKIDAFAKEEQAGLIPQMLITPMISDDSRRLLISALGTSYLMRPIAPTQPRDYFEIDALDFRRFLGNQGADKLSIATALRMNATYPYILPNVHLPTSPVKAVMDAGFRDNYGTMTSLRFVTFFADWIKKNTSGVTIVQINGWDKLDKIEEGGKTLLGKLLSPIGATMRSIEVQDYEQDAQLSMLSEVLGQNKLQIIRFVYRPDTGKERASVTFHLTKREKADIQSAIYQSDNQQGLLRLKRLLGN